MMPIFFHIESHLWIAYLFFFNGLLIHWLLRRCSPGYRKITQPLEAQVLAAFFISISLNGILLLCLDLAGQDFASLAIILPAITVGLLLASYWNFSLIEFQQTTRFEIDFWRISLYAVVFIILFYNGGLIEQTSDAWWHMSLANKIAIESTFTTASGHLNGVSSRYYPPLWHGNLALANVLSGVSIPVYWNSFTAWGAVLKVMGFFLLAFSLSKNSAIALLSAFFFVILPGVGDAYLRVAAWPSHIAYTALFCLLYVSFSMLDSITADTPAGVIARVQALITQASGIVCAVLLLLVINFTHQAEVLWFALAVLFYFIGVSIHRVFSSNRIKPLEPADWPLNLVGRGLLIVALAASIWLFFQSWNRPPGFSDLVITNALPVLSLSVLLYLQFKNSGVHWLFNQSPAKVLLITIGALLLVSVDLRHLLSLFSPDLAYPKAQYPQLPLVAKGWLGGDLNIPGWHLQLRSGLLYSGVAAIPLALFLAFYRPSRITVFLASTASLAFLFCVSPYLYHWLRDILNYHSPWRISVLIFHPIIFAVAIHMTWLRMLAKEEA